MSLRGPFYLSVAVALSSISACRQGPSPVDTSRFLRDEIACLSLINREQDSGVAVLSALIEGKATKVAPASGEGRTCVDLMARWLKNDDAAIRGLAEKVQVVAEERSSTMARVSKVISSIDDGPGGTVGDLLVATAEVTMIIRDSNDLLAGIGIDSVRLFSRTRADNFEQLIDETTRQDLAVQVRAAFPQLVAAYENAPNLSSLLNTDGAVGTVELPALLLYVTARTGRAPDVHPWNTNPSPKEIKTADTGLAFRKLCRRTQDKVDSGVTAKAAAAAFAGETVSLDAIVGDDLPGICEQCVGMDAGNGLKFVVAAHQNLNPLQFLIFASKHRRQRVHIEGEIRGSSDWPGWCPLVVAVKSIEVESRAEQAQPDPLAQQLNKIIKDVPTPQTPSQRHEASKSADLDALGSGWRRYSNRTLGVSLEIPPGISGANQSAGSDGALFQNPAGLAGLFVFRFADGASIDDAFFEAKQGGRQEYRRTTYEVIKSDWYAVSGFEGDDESNIFYEKGIVTSKGIVAASLSFPVTSRAAFDPHIKRFANSIQSLENK